MSVTIYNPDPLRAAVEAASGGRNTVLYDDLGMPSHMVIIPKFNVEDLDTDLGTGVHPAFLVDGVEKREMFIGQYQASVIGGRAVSLPGQDPATSIDFDTAAGYCTAKGTGWHLMTNWEWAAIMHWCVANGSQPRGNNYYGRSYAATHETGRRQDGLAPADTSGVARTLTGSGPASWRHDGTFAGIADLVGNVWEWVGGMKFLEGQIIMPADNAYEMDEADWPATGVYLDGTASGASGDVGDVVLATEISNAIAENGYLSNNWASGTTKTAAYSALSAALQQRMMQAGFDPSFNTSDPAGAILIRNNGERLPLRGGDWYDAAIAGLGALDIGYPRSSMYTHVGFRPAFIL